MRSVILAFIVSRSFDSSFFDLAWLSYLCEREAKGEKERGLEEQSEKKKKGEKNRIRFLFSSRSPSRSTSLLFLFSSSPLLFLSCSRSPSPLLLLPCKVVEISIDCKTRVGLCITGRLLIRERVASVIVYRPRVKLLLVPRRRKRRNSQWPFFFFRSRFLFWDTSWLYLIAHPAEMRTTGARNVIAAAVLLHSLMALWRHH